MNNSNLSFKSVNNNGIERKKTILEQTLSILGDISSRGAGGGIATKLASPIV